MFFLGMLTTVILIFLVLAIIMVVGLAAPQPKMKRK